MGVVLEKSSCDDFDTIWQNCLDKSYTRTEEPKVSEMLKAAENIMCQAAIYNTVHYGELFKMTKSSATQIENFVLFNPA